MTGQPIDLEERVTAAEIGLAVGLNLQAVTNWARRYANFPAPHLDGKQKVYMVADVLRWLDQRPIDDRYRTGEEAADVTYGQRFRRHYGLPGRESTPAFANDNGPARDRQPPTAPSAEPAFRAGLADRALIEVMSALGSGNDKATPQDVVTALLWLRRSNPGRWARVVKGLPGIDLYQLQQFWTEEAHRASGPPWAPVDPHVNVWWRGRLSTVAKTLDALHRNPDNFDALWEGGLSRSGVVFDALLDSLAHDRHDDLGWYLTPGGVAATMVALVDPKPGELVVDPCCGYGELLAAAGQHVLATGRDPSDLNLRGVAQDERAWRITAMRAAVHGLPMQVELGSDERLGSFPEEKLHGDVVVTNPPFARRDWTDQDPAHRFSPWPYGPPPRHSSTFAWLQLTSAALSANGRAAVVMPPGATDPGHSGEQMIMQGMIEDGVIRSVIDLPQYLFRETTSQVSIWILGPPRGGHRREVLLIDGEQATARQGSAHRVVTPAGKDRIVAAWRRWSTSGTTFDAESDFAASLGIEQIRDNGYVLAPARYLTSSPSAGHRHEPGIARSDPRVLDRTRLELARLQSRADELDAVLNHYLGQLGRTSPR